MTELPPAVNAVFAAGGPQLVERARAVDALVSELVAGVPGPTGRRAAEVVAAGGKRLRPLLALLVADEAAGVADDASPAAGQPLGQAAVDERSLRTAAAAVELVHVATLVHDDVLDRAPLRRGIPTVWAQDGASAATGAGDALLAIAFAVVARDAQPGVARVLAVAASSLAAGELMQRADAYRLDISAERYELRVIGKTAALFEAACRIGALHGAVDEDAAGEIGRDLGLAFQMLDDLLDVEGDPAVTGKARGTDLLDGTVTLPLTVAIARDPSIAAVDLRGLDEARAAELCDRIAASGANEVVRELAYARVDRAQGAIEALPGSAARRAALSAAARGIVDRAA